MEETPAQSPLLAAPSIKHPTQHKSTTPLCQLCDPPSNLSGSHRCVVTPCCPPSVVMSSLPYIDTNTMDTSSRHDFCCLDPPGPNRLRHLCPHLFTTRDTTGATSPRWAPRRQRQTSQLRPLGTRSHVRGQSLVLILSLVCSLILSLSVLHHGLAKLIGFTMLLLLS